MRQTPALIALLFLTATHAIRVQAAPPPTLDDIARELAQLADKQRKAETEEIQKIASALAQAAQSPQTALKAYQDAIFTVEFKGAQGAMIQFQEWKKNEEPKFRNKTFSQGLQIQLNYLALTARHLAGEPMKTMEPDIMNHVAQVQAYLENVPEEDQKFLEPVRQPVASGVFFQFYQMQGNAKNLKNWEMVPANFEGVLDRTIFPHYRTIKDPRLLALWDERIARIEKSVAKSKRTNQAERFDFEVKPQLLWNRARDESVIGDASLAAADMLTLIKQHPSHPNAGDWIRELQRLIEDRKKPNPPAGPSGQGPDQPAAPPESS